MALQDDWLVYVKDSYAFPEEHFAQLITDTEEPIDLQVAFGDLENGAELIKRIERVKNETVFTGLYYIPDKTKRLSRARLQILADRYAQSVSQRLGDIGEAEQAATIASYTYASTEFISESDYDMKFRRKELELLNTFMDIADDCIDFLYDSDPSYIMGLNEAVLFMTKVPSVTRYIVSAVVNYPVDDEAFYQLWAGGAVDIEFCEDKLLIVLPDDYDEPILGLRRKLYLYCAKVLKDSRLFSK